MSRERGEVRLSLSHSAHSTRTGTMGPASSKYAGATVHGCRPAGTIAQQRTRSTTVLRCVATEWTSSATHLASRHRWML